MKATYFFILTVLVFVNCQDANEIKNELEKSFGQIPNFDNSSLPNLPNEEDVEKTLREKCEKNGADPSVVDEIKSHKDLLRACIEKQVDVEVLKAEVEKSKKTGSMDEVFAKYCNKYPEIHKCLENVTDTMRKCMDRVEKDTLNKTIDIMLELKEFVCYKDGDRIAMFVAEGGVECFEERKDALQLCVNATVGSRVPTELSLSALPTFAFTNQNCKDFDKIRTCVVAELEKCKDSTPANIVQSFFKFLKKHIPCQFENTTEPAVGQSKKSSSSSIYASVALLVSTLLVYTQMY